MQLGSEEMDNFVKTLMRMYEGLFGGYVTIDEERIAKVGGYSVVAVEQKLKMLGARGVVHYIPKLHSPILYLKGERLYPDNLYLSKSDYESRLQRDKARQDAMIEYVTREDKCRSQLLLEYFGQKESMACGMCDVCRTRLRS